MLAVNGVSYTQLGEYVEQKNRWQAVFKAPEITFPLSQATADHLMEGIASAAESREPRRRWRAELTPSKSKGT